jgi:hypothetical protein
VIAGLTIGDGVRTASGSIKTRGGFIMAQQPTGQRKGFLHNLKWMFILWCVGFGATVLLTLPFHFLVEAMMKK